MRKKLVIANWKMNLNTQEALVLVGQLNNQISASAKMETVLCPSFTALEPVAAKLEPLKLKLGAQNIHHLDHGPFTGEVSASQLKGLVDYVIIGHSERRLHFGETGETIARKVSAAVRNNLNPVICVGENLFERQDNETARVVHDQLSGALVMLTTKEVASVVVAYEPVWAVDTDDIASPEQIGGAIKVIRKTVEELFGDSAASQVRVVYGGHADADNIGSYFRLKGLDGFLVGRASLNPLDFVSIIKATQQAGKTKASARS